MKDLAPIVLDAKEARNFVDQAKDILSGSRIQSQRRLTVELSREAWWLLDQAEARLSGLLTYAHALPTESGRKGGNATKNANVALDPEYYKKIAAMRKTRSGGRPKKSEEKAQSAI